MNKIKKLSKRIVALVLTFTLLFGGMISVSAAEYTSGNYTYTVTDGKAKITAYPETAKGAVEIPSKLGGYPVNEIGTYAFYACTLITEVTIPSGVTKIGDYAFAYCTSLTTVKIPSSVTSIGANAFKNSKDVVIECKKGSYAERYAVAKDIAFVELELNEYSYSDTWNFSNSEVSFIGDQSEYFIPAERYREVFGQTYVDNVTIPTSWGGNCFGMTATTILFHAGLLDWSAYNSLYTNDFSTVNQYYNTLRWQKPAWSFTRYFYSASDYNTEVTKLIERYQVIQESSISYGYGDYSTAGEVEGNYYRYNGSVNLGSEWLENYTHITTGDYIQTIFDTLIASEEPVSVGLRSRSGGHAIVIRTDKEPEEMSGGWWRFYVYDPNDPLLPDSYLDGKTLLPSYINNLINSGGDRYIELNPGENKFRYKGFVNADGDATEYWGCNEAGNVIYQTKQVTSGGIIYRISYPEYMVIRDLAACLPTSFNGTEPWDSGDGETTISVNGEQEFRVLDCDDKLIAVVSDGECVVLNPENARYDVENGVVNEGVAENPGGKLSIYLDNVKISYTQGNMDLIGDDSVISFSSTEETPIELIIDGDSHEIIATSDNSAEINAKVCNVNGSDSYETAYVSGVIGAGETVELTVDTNGLMTAASDNAESKLILSCKNEDDYVDLGSINDYESFDVRNIEDVETDTDFGGIVDLEVEVSYKGTTKLLVSGNTSNLIWSSSDESVAKVDSNGNVTAVGTGTAIITATVEGTDISDSCEVNVSYAWWQWIIRILLLGFIWY